MKEQQKKTVMLKSKILFINSRMPFINKCRIESLLNILWNALVLGRHLLRKNSLGKHSSIQLIEISSSKMY